MMEEIERLRNIVGRLAAGDPELAAEARRSAREQAEQEAQAAREARAAADKAAADARSAFYSAPEREATLAELTPDDLATLIARPFDSARTVLLAVRAGAPTLGRAVWLYRRKGDPRLFVGAFQREGGEWVQAGPELAVDPDPALRGDRGGVRWSDPDRLTWAAVVAPGLLESLVRWAESAAVVTKIEGKPAVRPALRGKRWGSNPIPVLLARGVR